MDLFDHNLAQKLQSEAPLADRMRPQHLDDFVGQHKIVGQGTLLRNALENDEVPSMIFWGPPGTGKSTLARIVANMTKSAFVQLSAVTAGVKDLRAIIEQARNRRKFNGQRTILFIDEIHRWNKAQQDALLPLVEQGVITLIGATTENPSFEVVSALLSRSRVFVLEQHTAEDLENIITRAVQQGFDKRSIAVSDEARTFLATMANGDARVALNALEFAVSAQVISNKSETVALEIEQLKEALQKSTFLYDKGGEQHYNIISALHKSVRGGDADAALYWMGRMIEAGEDPLYVARRLVRMAVEDIGLADPRALEQAVACYQACHWVGLPECDVILGQCVVYLARAPKSVEVYKAYQQVKKDVRDTMDEPVPLHLRNAPTQLMKELDYGKGYQYSPDHNWEDNQQYMPERLKNKKYLNQK